MNIQVELPETIIVGGKKVLTKTLIKFQCKTEIKLALMKELPDGWVCITVLWYNPRSNKGVCLSDIRIKKADLIASKDDQGFTIYARKKPQRASRQRSFFQNKAANCV